MAIPRLRRYDPPPAEVLGPEVIARLSHFKQVCAIETTFGIEGPEADRFAGRLIFFKWRYQTARCSEWSR